jgi:hypothetical protein
MMKRKRKIRNPKSPHLKFETNSNNPNSNNRNRNRRLRRQNAIVLNFETLNFDIVLDFVLRIYFFYLRAPSRSSRLIFMANGNGLMNDEKICVYHCNRRYVDGPLYVVTILSHEM